MKGDRAILRATRWLASAEWAILLLASPFFLFTRPSFSPVLLLLPASLPSEGDQERDAATIDSFYSADITTIFDGEIHRGLAAVQASRDEEWAENPDATVDWTTTEVGVAASGDLAYERGHWTSDPDGAGEEPEEYGEYLTVWKKIDGQWKVLYDSGTVIEEEEEFEGD